MAGPRPTHGAMVGRMNLSLLVLFLLPSVRAGEEEVCPDEGGTDTGTVTADLSCDVPCDGCCADDGSCLDGLADDACGVAETCQDCTAWGDTCDAGTCTRVAWTSFGYHDDDELDIATIEDAVRVREDALQFIFGTKTLPTDEPTSVQAGVESPITGLVGLSRVDRLTMELSDGFTSVAYLFHPEASNGKLMIFHQGHSTTYGENGGSETVGFFLERGWQVAAMCMPLYGQCTGPYGSHGDMYNASFDGYSYLSFFLGPVVQVVNYGQNVLKASEIDMIGISGGGWTTTLAAALDPRIRVSVPVAGSVPIHLRSRSRDLGDAEQYGYEFYQIVGYPDLYVLGSIGAGRRQLQVLNRFDSCCFAGTLYQDYEAEVAARVQELAPGSFSAFLDPSHESHLISEFALNAAIVHAVDDDGVRIVDDIGPSYGDFRSTGTWEAVEHAASFGGWAQTSSSGGDSVTWTHAGQPGLYRVSATWAEDPGLASVIPVTVVADETRETTVDQAAPPVGWTDASATWQDLAAEIHTSTGALSVTMVVPEGGAVRADAVRFQQLCVGCEWYRDGDGDGFGDGDLSQIACSAEEGWVEADGDCDDGRADVYPGAEEIAEDGVDQDCDGQDGAQSEDSGTLSTDSGTAPTGEGDPPPKGEDTSTCGCAAGLGGPGLAGVLGVAALAIAGRRRRRGGVTG